MLADFDLATVRLFAEDLHRRRRACNEEGMFCSDLDQEIGCQFAVCEELQSAVNRWANAVLSGATAFSPEVDELFRREVHAALTNARPLVEHGRDVETECFSLGKLSSLQAIVSEFDSLLKNWVSPQKSVAPAPRVVPGEATDHQIRQRIASLPPLGPNWQPLDKNQTRRLNG